MKKLLLSLIVLTLFASCTKDEVIPQQNSEDELIKIYCDEFLPGYSVDKETGIYYRITKKGGTPINTSKFSIKYIGKFIYWAPNNYHKVKGTIFDALPNPYESMLLPYHGPFQNVFMSLYGTGQPVGKPGYLTAQNFVLKNIGIGGEMDVVVPCYMDGNSCDIVRYSPSYGNQKGSPLHYYIKF